MATSLNSANTNQQPVYTEGGGRSLPLTMDFSADTAFTFDIGQAIQQGVIPGVQTLYVDNSGNNAQLTITTPNGQILKVPPSGTGYVPVLSKQNGSFTFALTGGTSVTNITLLDKPVLSAAIFGTLGGIVAVSDAVLDACVSANKVAVNIAQSIALAVTNAGLTALATTISAGAVAVSNAALTALATTISAGAVAVSNAALTALNAIIVGGALLTRPLGWSINNPTTATTTVVKSGAGTFHGITINTPVVASTVTIYDNTAASGTKIATVSSAAVGSLQFDAAFATGLTVVTSGATDITILYA